MRILLTCAAGMSTSLVVNKMLEIAKNQGKEDYKIWAVDYDSIDKQIGNFDVCLIGPQLAFRRKKIEKIVGDSAPVDVINPAFYGRTDGAAILKFAEDLYEQFKGEK